MKLERLPYGILDDGTKIDAFSAANGDLTFQALSYGAILSSVSSRDRNGEMAELTLGFDDLAGWSSRHPYFGATVGRFANRIARGRFELDGREYSLYTNDGKNHLHGGKEGFNRLIWDGFPFQNEQEAGVKFSRTSPAGEEGYPGNLDVTVTYALSVDNELSFTWEAVCDAPTILNLTNHAYWNLDGSMGKTSILDHELKLYSSRFVEVDAEAIPSGKVQRTAGTALDFSSHRKIGAHIDEAGGYDFCYVIDREASEEPALAAELYSPASGRVMKVYTTQPGIQLYTGNFLDGTILLRDGVPAARYSALCLETQGFPDAPNQDTFPSVVLRPGELYRHKTVHHFSVV
jgi:aldose 1-epimerase